MGVPLRRSKKVYLEGVGEVLLEPSSRARHINLSVRPFKGVRVGVPRRVSFKQAEAFARANADWIKKHLSEASRLEQAAKNMKGSFVADRKTARKQLVARLDALCERHGFRYNKVFVRNQKTRWGSCSGSSNINLNVNLVHLPAPLMDYAILHELVHTRVMNHSKRFWEELDRLVGDGKKLDRELKMYRALLL
jgi:predicted metal-dependent hydrolase